MDLEVEEKEVVVVVEVVVVEGEMVEEAMVVEVKDEAEMEEEVTVGAVMEVEEKGHNNQLQMHFYY